MWRLNLTCSEFAKLAGWTTRRARRYLINSGMGHKQGGRWLAIVHEWDIPEDRRRKLELDLYYAQKADPKHPLNLKDDDAFDAWIRARIAELPRVEDAPRLVKPGDRFGHLVVLEPAESDPHYGRRWLCQCDCGKTTTVLQANLRSGRTISCGCAQAERRTRLATILAAKNGGKTTVKALEYKYRNGFTKPDGTVIR